MTHSDNKIQAYLTANTKAILAKKAEEKSMSLSRYASQILEESAEQSITDKVYRAKVLSILSHILTCVYDKEILISNTEVSQELLDKIKEECKKVFI